MTSNTMTRWRVAQTYTSPQRRTPLDGRKPEWQAWSEDGRHLKRGFHSHTEAITYADRMARTVEVTLPRKTTGIKIGKHTTASVSHANRGAVALTVHDKAKGPTVIFVKGNRIKSLALALLKYHYTQEHT